MNDNESTAYHPQRESSQDVSEYPKVIPAACPNCEKRYKLGSDKAGKRVKCRECGTLISLPRIKPKKNPVQTPTLQSSSVRDTSESDLKKSGR
ncbi:MAG: hypothetical protein KDA84_24205 [Planctomycetaceae bacterium]|nr:hypothetical protein [Planctomycetaceae bacterium]